MASRRWCCLVALALFVSSLVWGSLAWGQSARPQRAVQNGGDFSNNVQPANKVPAGVILVKGAWSSASDSVTPLPEGGRVTDNIFNDQYFGMSYALLPGWIEKYQGPRPTHCSWSII